MFFESVPKFATTVQRRQILGRLVRPGDSLVCGNGDLFDAFRGGEAQRQVIDGRLETRRGSHVLKALAAGATACSFGKAFLFSLGAGGERGVEKLLENMQQEIRRNMILMGCKNVKDLDASKIIYRN